MQYGFPMQPGTFGQMGGPMAGGMNQGSMMGTFGAFHCPVCGYSGPVWHPGLSPAMAGGGFGGFGPGFNGAYGGWGLGGLRRWGGTYSPQYAATGLPTDEEITEMVYDSIDADPLIPYDADINVEVEAGTVVLSGTVPNKTVKHAAGDDTWWVPGVTDLHNNLTVSGQRRIKSAPRAGMTETATTSQTTKPRRR
ncbi:MAG: BON domain-containing protein [Chloroflexi bacterium]|nr:BON domain-containing protein [Chloroflexota bacterium]